LFESIIGILVVKINELSFDIRCEHSHENRHRTNFVISSLPIKHPTKISSHLCATEKVKKSKNQKIPETEKIQLRILVLMNQQHYNKILDIWSENNKKIQILGEGKIVFSGRSFSEDDCNTIYINHER